MEKWIEEYKRVVEEDGYLILNIESVNKVFSYIQRLESCQKRVIKENKMLRLQINMGENP